MVQTKYIRNLQELEWNKEYWLYIITQGPVANNTRGFKVIPVVFKSPIYSNNGTNYRFRLANDNRQTYMVMNGPLHEMMNEVGGWKVLKYNRSDRSGGHKKSRKKNEHVKKEENQVEKKRVEKEARVQHFQDIIPNTKIGMRQRKRHAKTS